MLCVLPPELFSIYNERIMEYITSLREICKNSYKISKLRYAHDDVLIAENEDDLDALVNIIVRGSSKMGLS